jgi:hypothetical protein
MKGTQRNDSDDLSNKGHQPRYTLMTSGTNVTNRNVHRLGTNTSLNQWKPNTVHLNLLRSYGNVLVKLTNLFDDQPKLLHDTHK